MWAHMKVSIKSGHMYKIGRNIKTFLLVFIFFQIDGKTDRHHYLESGNIPKILVAIFYYIFVSSHMISIKFH